MTKRHHFGHEGGPYRNVRFGLHQSALVFAGKDKEWNARLTRYSALTFREIISDGRLESEDRKLIRKPMFFGGSIVCSNDDFFDDNYKWLRQIGNRRFFLLNMRHIVPLSYLQLMSIQRQMGWDLVKSQQGVSIGRITNRGVVLIGSDRDVIRLFSGLVRHKYLRGEIPKQANSFIH